MPSKAKIAFDEAQKRAALLVSLASEPRLRPISFAKSQTLLHAALAMSVAGWEQYVESIVKEFFDETSDPAATRFQSIHQLLLDRAVETIGKFNTPNWNNSRNLLMHFTGYDPIADWVWPRRRLDRIKTQETFKEILDVRHSFAHGFSMPACRWNQTSSGKTQLSASAVEFAIGFLDNVAKQTDRGLKKHIKAALGVRVRW